ncbi:MAG: hypothetical protein AUK16_01655 [Parcubacteria group bacterium CG2_30_44_11]|nr:MAG: hypothetical protein AUK16_01655 [Parcubacteria group bacterium CG2_30_44_11]
MFAKLDELRKKPKHVRNRYAFWLATIFTLCVAGVWVTTLPTRLALITSTAAGTVSTAEVRTLGSRWSSMTAAVRSSFNRSRIASAVVESTPNQIASSTPTTTDMVWTEAAASKYIEYDNPARTILIGTTSKVIATSSKATTNVIQ